VRKLILGQIPDDFHPDTHIAIAPSCFVGKEHIYPEFENLDFIECYESPEELAYLDKLTNEEALFLVTMVAKKYNPENYSKYSFQFWKMVYYPILGLLIPWLHRKQIIVRKFVEKYKDENIEVILAVNINLEFKDDLNWTREFLWNSYTLEWAYSKIIETQIPSKWKKRYKEHNTSRISRPDVSFSLKEKFKSLLVSRFIEMFHYSFGIYGFSKFDVIYFHYLLSFKPKIVYRKKQFIEHESTTINWDIDIETIIDKVIPEDHKRIDIKQFSTKETNNYGKITNFSNRINIGIYTKVRAALINENNGIVLTTQHGGHNSGSALTIEFGRINEYNVDYCITWGWGTYDKNDLRKNFIPLPSPILSKKLDSHTNITNNIILVGTMMEISVARFDSAKNEVQSLKYRKNKLKFIDKLLIDSIMYRPYPENHEGFLDWEYVKNKSKNIKRLGGNLHTQIQHCKLLVLDNPGTTWNIAMAMNTPIICFWERNHFPFNEEANMFLSKFEELGLYFEDPQKAALKVNVLLDQYSDLTKWWNQKAIQELRKDWMTEYARADKNWRWIWTKVLWKLGK
jgi:putative transferase (TIGR04331 family)